ASVGICLAHVQQAKLQYAHMFTEYFGIFCGRFHPLFGREDIDRAELKGQPSISFVTDQMNEALRPVTLMRAELGLSDHLVGSSPNLEEIKRMICAGVGIGPLPVHVARLDVEGGFLWQLPPYSGLPQIEINVVWNPDAKLNRAERAFIDLLLLKISNTPPELRDYQR
ncbi:LysR family transcriptional regulator substrate-binding protein, partial [Ensifer canadensis]